MNIMEILLDYGDGKMAVDLPEDSVVVRYGQTYTDPPAVDPREAVRKALENPLGSPPLSELAGPDKKVVIAFPDRVKGGSSPNSHRRTSIPIILEELLAAGTKMENIHLLCAPGLHRHNTLEEFYSYLGKDIVNLFYPDRISNHDAEADDLLDLGEDEMGNAVQLNRQVAEADLAIMIGHCAGNPYGGYSGGHKMVATGLSGWRSIASHHCPKTMHREDWLGASPKSHMRKQFTSIGQAMEKGMGKQFFVVDAVLGQHAQVLQVAAGTLAEVEKATWPLAAQRTNVHLDMDERADILVVGLPRNFHYGPGMGSNPILMSLAIGGQLTRCWNALRPDPIIIAAAVCDGWFNPHWFPSYEETYHALQRHCTAAEFLTSSDMMDIVNNKEYRYSYSNYNTYHPFHAMSMISGGSVPQLRCPAVFLVGPQKPEYARGMGMIPVSTFDQAMDRARRLVGAKPRVLCTPECFSGGTAVHLHMKQ
ncbi:hypothetical protein DQK91_20475 [Oceanidesulfovibrio marinus]|uniref:LarA-like N-terminal domain-containing protein n=2 Tax=Oceanidesulfovibrio marinus TaxID=370038 RepID=A0A6P1ZEA5_9BACT|nr:hypothetical protein DQK91_20475 [Oceanidesulfovibrio marinus]